MHINRLEVALDFVGTEEMTKARVCIGPRGVDGGIVLDGRKRPVK